MEANAEYGDYSGWSSSFSTYISFIIYYSYIFMCYSLPVELYFMYIERSNATIVVALYTQKYSVGPNLNVISVVRNTLVMLVILKKTHISCCNCSGKHFATSELWSKFSHQKEIKTIMADKCISYGKVANMITPISSTYANVVSTPVSANYPLL